MRATVGEGDDVVGGGGTCPATAPADIRCSEDGASVAVVVTAVLVARPASLVTLPLMLRAAGAWGEGRASRLDAGSHQGALMDRRNARRSSSAALSAAVWNNLHEQASQLQNDRRETTLVWDTLVCEQWTQ